MRILVLAEAVDRDRTSAGIGTMRLLRALSHEGHDILCLHLDGITNEVEAGGCLQIRRIRYTRWSWLNIGAYLVGLLGHSGRRLDQRYRRKHGFSLKYQHDVAQWVTAIRDAVATFHPDIIFTRARGMSFRTHVAMLRAKPAVPWIANYHDPWPGSQYPPPYQWAQTGEEHLVQLHKRIIAEADALTLPSLRLVEWLARYDPDMLGKSFVLPHVMDTEPVSTTTANNTPSTIQLQINEKEWVVLHAGTLLGPRNPNALIRGFIRFIAEQPVERNRARLHLVGPVQAGLDPIPHEYAHRVKIVDRRVSHQESLSLLRQASVLVILEAVSEVSPFLPGKLPDYLSAGKFILLLTPEMSELARIFGPDYPYRRSTDDEDGIFKALRTIWEQQTKGQYEDPRNELAREHCGAANVMDAFHRAVLHARVKHHTDVH